MTLAVKVALNFNTTSQSLVQDTILPQKQPMAYKEYHAVCFEILSPKKYGKAHWQPRCNRYNFENVVHHHTVNPLINHLFRSIDRLNGVLRHIQQYFSHITTTGRQLTLFTSFLGFTSTRLDSKVSCQRTLPKKPRVNHFISMPRRTPYLFKGGRVKVI